MHPPPSPPDSHYTWLGRIVSACSILEVQIGMIGWAATTGERWTEDWFPIAGSWDKSKKLLRVGLPLLSAELANQVREVVAASKPLRDERNALAHASFILDPQTSLASNPWLIRTTRNIERPLLSGEEGGELVRGMNSLSRQAANLRIKAADYVRAGRRTESDQLD